jgi:hypothetical protein
MGLLTPRQETAQRLARELQSFGATVTNVMPLDNGQNLRFWCSDYEKKELLQQLKDAGHEVVFLGMSPQVEVSRPIGCGLAPTSLARDRLTRPLCSTA